MKIFIIEEAYTDAYHSEAGLVIIAESLESAESLVVKYNNTPRKKRHNEEYYNITDPCLEDAVISEIEATKEDIWLFPNAGCC